MTRRKVERVMSRARYVRQDDGSFKTIGLDWTEVTPPKPPEIPTSTRGVQSQGNLL